MPDQRHASRSESPRAAAIEAGRRAINEHVSAQTLRKAAEGHPWAEEWIANAVVTALQEKGWHVA